MLSLEQQQRSLFTFFRQRPADHSPNPGRGPAIGSGASNNAPSPRLQVIHDVALWWQRMQIEWHCRYTSRLMKRLGCFDEYVAAHFREYPTPPSMEEMSAQFLASLKNHEDPVLRAVARLELACIRPFDSRTPSASWTSTTTIYWDRNPNQVMDALDQHVKLPEPEPRVRYILRMGSGLPNGVSCIRQVLRA
jgi:hypothetical protein